MNTSDLAPIFGNVAAVITTVRLLPQVHKTWKTKHTSDIAGLFIVFLNIQAFFLILYGLTKPDLLIAGMNVIPLLSSIYLGYMKIKNG